MDEKIHKVLARAGYGSRREIEGWLREGRIRVNGQVATLGDRIRGDERIQLNGRPLRLRQVVPRTIIYHKPVGEVCTRKDPEGRPTIFEHIPRPAAGRWISVGRLDLNTSGLLLLTTDGELANRLMHPSSEVEREYAVRVLGPLSEESLQQLREGVMLEDGEAHFHAIRHAGGEGRNQWYHVVLREGRFREVRRLFEAVGATVSRLMRVRYGPIAMPR
ncbi:MAG TPA: pseudouridine synthase, partial [Gammaproteobacteria bacterium]|nr:pseudouridine synthase [Gammaproteobacteria bacterium]